MLDLEFKIKLLVLYPNFDKVYGPYTRGDNRKHLVLNNSKLSHGDKNKLRTLSYPKAIIEVEHGKILIDDETTDHVDEDFTNDEIINLQILSRADNIIKSAKNGNYFYCSNKSCNNMFYRSPSRAKDHMFCSNYCRTRVFFGNQYCKTST